MTIWGRGTSQSEHQGCDMKEINAVGVFLKPMLFYGVFVTGA